jgi:hypothetical protein
MLKMFFVGALMLASSSAVLAREPGAYQRPNHGIARNSEFGNDNHFGIGFAGPLDTRFERFARHHDGYDGNRHWSGNDCFPTEPDGCD